MERKLLSKLSGRVCLKKQGEKKRRGDEEKGREDKMCDELSCSLKMFGQPDYSCQHRWLQEQADIIMIPPISRPVWTSAWTSITRKQILPPCGVCHGTDRKWQWPLPKDAPWWDLHLFSLHLSVPGMACSWRMWQRVCPNKVPQDREGWSIAPGGEKGWGIWRWQKKKSFVASTEGHKPCDGWTMKEKSADLTPMTPFPIQPPTLLFFFHALSCLLPLSWSNPCDMRSRVCHCVILHS